MPALALEADVPLQPVDVRLVPRAGVRNVSQTGPLSIQSDHSISPDGLVGCGDSIYNRRPEAQMLDRLQDHAKGFDGYTELRWHANHAVRLAMRKGALLQITQTREGGVSARCYRSGAFGFACRPGDTDEAL